jgi:chaperonin GroES
MIMKFKPLGKRALVKLVECEETTSSGIVLPDTAKEKPQTAEVAAIGDSEDVKVGEGDIVVFAKYSGTEIKLDDENYLILDSDDILGIVEK